MVGPSLKYIVVQDSTSVVREIHKIDKHLELPKGNTSRYATGKLINNFSHALSGQYIIPIIGAGVYKCDDLYDSNELVSYDADWFTIEPTLSGEN